MGTDCFIPLQKRQQPLYLLSLVQTSTHRPLTKQCVLASCTIITDLPIPGTTWASLPYWLISNSDKRAGQRSVFVTGRLAEEVGKESGLGLMSAYVAEMVRHGISTASAWIGTHWFGSYPTLFWTFYVKEGYCSFCELGYRNPSTSVDANLLELQFPPNWVDQVFWELQSRNTD